MIRILENFVPKNYNLWLFSLDKGGGSRFAGNSWYLYNYVKNNHPEIRALCVTSSSFVKQKLKRNNGDYFSPNSFRSFITALRAGVYICTNELHEDIINFSKKNTYKVNVWHGMIIKKIGYASPLIKERVKNRSFLSRFREILLRKVKLNEYDFIPCTSKNLVEVFKETFNTSKIFVTGQPRDDFFFKKVDRNIVLEKYGFENLIDKKIICYLPTHRDIRKVDEKYFIFENNQVAQEKLKENNLFILQKNHYTKVDTIKVNKNIYNLNDDFDVQELLYISDILITDYSSCYFDYLHTQRPIIFYPYDFKDYTTYDRELYFDYFDDIVSPGQKVNNEKELLSTILFYHNNPSVDAEKRKNSLKFFHEKSDGNSSKRTFMALVNDLNVNNYFVK